jgi:pimeloyl-ACP methyl ester carboxylesterase
MRQEDVMKWNYYVGYHRFLDEVNMNFQLNRFLSIGSARFEDLKDAASRIRTLADWRRELLALAEVAEGEGRTLNAMTYHRAAEFFMVDGDPEKEKAYDRFIELFHEAYADDLREGLIIQERVPYGDGYLPVMRLPAGDEKNRGTILIHGGFDSFIEELYALCDYFRLRGYDVVAFEGPGQGAVLRKHNISMTPEWERPVGAVLDHYGLNDVTLLGISLGGYLGLRAAAFEPRISRVIAFNIIYDFFEVLVTRRGWAFETILRLFSSIGLGFLLNLPAQLKMRRDPFVAWGIHQGMSVFGVDSPYRYIREAKKYHTRDISPLITQDVLLTAGSEDHFVPLDFFYRQGEILTNARSLTGRIFTGATGNENHCQVGNILPALSFIADWVDRHAGESCAESGKAKKTPVSAAG